MNAKYNTTMTKFIYEAPSTELVEVLVEGNFLGSLTGATNALGHSSTEEATDYNGGNAISW